MQDEMIHALPLAFSYHGAHFYDLRARAQDDGDHGSPCWYLWVVSGEGELHLLIIVTTWLMLLVDVL